MNIIEFSCIFSIGGLFAGFTAGLFGLGGGAVLVPLFLFLLPKIGATLDATMHQAVGTSLAIIVFSAFAAALKQYKTNNLDLSLLKAWIPFVLLGVLAATAVFKYIPALTLEILFMSYLILCAGYMYFKNPILDPATKSERKISSLSLSCAGIFVGALSTFLGIGGGTFTVPYYMANHYSLKKSIALSSATGLFIGIVGALSAIYSGYGSSGLANYSLGYVNILSLILITPFSMFAATYGVKINHRLNEQTLKILYVIFLLVIVCYVYYHTFIFSSAKPLSH